MPITKKNLLYSTFIGLPVEVSNSSHRDLIGLKGMVVDETKNLIVIEKEQQNIEKSEISESRTKVNEVKIPKISSVFRFTCESGETVDINGKDICFRPHERPKKV
ncbi:ribonuclease P protein subunit [Candidatus Micrarchaeota archaeon]|nr:ribonuclease P protein subunit [Candidatus Micrarchaeota archaeon]MBU1165950.1 ribonuclease P protein subunit [Candidatus Micrarchaeota archaeon]MBU1886854.1 ribonuclease P protein subunit [Candidatus Micrarchaeota archaeon]